MNLNLGQGQICDLFHFVKVKRTLHSVHQNLQYDIVKTSLRIDKNNLPESIENLRLTENLLRD